MNFSSNKYPYLFGSLVGAGGRGDGGGIIKHEKKLKTLEKEKPNEMEVAEKKAQKGKTQEKGAKS